MSATPRGRFRSDRAPDTLLAPRALADVAGLVVLGTFGGVWSVLAITNPPVDALIFWSAAQAPSPYSETWAGGTLFVYPPPLAQLLRPLDWAMFVLAWMPPLFIAFWVATREYALPIFMISFGFAATVGFGFALSNPAALTLIGNPQILIAGVCVLGRRYPALWSLAILTKLAPVIGLLWFLTRREWRQLAVAAGTTAAVCTVSVLLGPADWLAWFRFAFANAGAASPEPVVGVPLAIRIPMAVVLIVWGARTDRPWTIPLAVGWSAIALYEWSALTVWIAALPLLGSKRDGPSTGPAKTQSRIGRLSRRPTDRHLADESS